MPDQLPIFVINMRRATERRERMIELLTGMGLSPRIFEAVDGRQMDSDGKAYWQGSADRAHLSPGEIGCMLSHIRVWQKVLAEGFPQAVVLEDDLCIASSFPAVLRATGALQHVELVKLETDLSRNVRIDRRPVGQVGGVGCHRLRKGAYRTGGYLIRAEAAARLLSASKEFRYALDVEMFDRRRSRFQNITVHQLVPAGCMQAELRPSLTQCAPYLESSIKAMGARLDTVLGLNGQDETGIGAWLRRALRPAKRLLAKCVWGLVGQQRGQIPFAGDYPEMNPFLDVRAAPTAADLKASGKPHLV